MVFLGFLHIWTMILSHSLFSIFGGDPNCFVKRRNISFLHKSLILSRMLGSELLPIRILNALLIFLLPSLFLKFYCFIFGCAGSLLLPWLFSSCGRQGLLSSCNVWAFHCGGFSCCRAPSRGSRHVRFSSCSSWAPEHRLCRVAALRLSCSMACVQ